PQDVWLLQVVEDGPRLQPNVETGLLGPQAENQILTHLRVGSRGVQLLLPQVSRLTPLHIRNGFIDIPMHQQGAAAHTIHLERLVERGERGEREQPSVSQAVRNWKDASELLAEVEARHDLGVLLPSRAAQT